MKNPMQEAEALFAGLGKPKPESEAELHPTLDAESGEAGGKRRRRIVAGATVTPQPLLPPDEAEPRREVQDRMSRAIRSLGGHDDSVRVARRRALPSDPRTPSPVRRKTFDPKTEPVSVRKVEVRVDLPSEQTLDGSRPAGVDLEPAREPAARPAVAQKADAAMESYLVRVSAPSVTEEELCFYLDGTDVAGVAGRAREQVGSWMAERHGGADWDMRSIERVPGVLR